MKIFDTFSQQKHLLTEQTISIYLCGPTVYNHVHLGNIRPLITFDVFHRILRFKKIPVNIVHNITDIDDKIIKQAVLEHSSELVLANQYTIAYFQIMDQMNVIRMHHPRVSENISGIIAYIEELIANQAAYVVNGDVYFRVDCVKSYGSLSKNHPHDLRIGERIEIDTKKINPLDFVLWKQTTEGLKWSSPWSLGRPGWHTECAYLIWNHFGKQITIHGGGIDLLFPHHENELSQHLSLTNHPISKYWMHIGQLTINQQKMSKSLGNFIYVKQLLETYDFRVLRWFFYQSHYRSPINFSNAVLQNAIKDIEKITLSLNKAKTMLVLNHHSLPSTFAVNADFLQALEDDLNFANATKIIWDLVRKLNECINKKDFKQLTTICSELLWCLDLYGILPENIHTQTNIDLIRQWGRKVLNKEFKDADAIRARLQTKKLL